MSMDTNKWPVITDDDRQFLQDNPNTEDLINWVRVYARAAIALAQPPAVDSSLCPVCWHPVQTVVPIK